MRSTRPALSFARNGGSHGSEELHGREQRRHKVERDYRIMYDANGRLRPLGLLQILYEEFGVPVARVVGLLGFIYLWTKYVVGSMVSFHTKEMNRIEDANEQKVRETGKVQADRYIVKQRRVIDDPDWKIPSYSGETAKSKLFEEDRYSASNERVGRIS